MDNDITMRLRFLGAKKAESDARHVAQDTRKIGAAADHTSRKTARMGKVFVGARKGIGPLRAGVTGLTGALGFTGAVGLAGAFKVMYDEATQAVKVSHQTTAALKSTGAEAWITKSHIGELATSLSNVSGIQDDAIQNGENLLLTFTKIRNEAGKGNKIFDRTSRTMVDFAARFTGGKMDRAAILLGKALNDPVKGMTALTRVGVSFDKGQQDQIKTLVAHNDLLGAQKLILGEVNKQVKGQAAASTTPMQKLQNTLRNVAQTVGLKFLPFVNKAARAVQKWVNEVVKGTGQGGRFRDQVVRIWNAAKPVVLWFGRAAKNIFKFASGHPDLVKIGVAMWAVHRALKVLRFGGAISGAWRLYKTIKGIRDAKFGASIAKELVTKVGAVPGRLGRWKSGFATAGKLAGAAYVASFITQLLNLPKEADPLLFLHPPSAGDPRPGHGDVPLPSRSIGKPHRNRRGELVQDYVQGGKRHHQVITTAPPRHANPKLLTVPQAAAAPAGAGDTVVHVVNQLDGQVLWESNHRIERKNRNRR